jgi:hypothetical protein
MENVNLEKCSNSLWAFSAPVMICSKPLRKRRNKSKHEPEITKECIVLRIQRTQLLSFDALDAIPRSIYTPAQ